MGDIYGLIAFVIILVGYIACVLSFFSFYRRGIKTTFIYVAILGLVFPPIGILVGWYYIFFVPSMESMQKSTENNLINLNSRDLVDVIDRGSCSSLFASNSEYLKNNWHTMKDEEKVKWVEERKELLAKHLASTENFVVAVQEADKEFQRSTKKAA